MPLISLEQSLMTAFEKSMDLYDEQKSKWRKKSHVASKVWVLAIIKLRYKCVIVPPQKTNNPLPPTKIPQNKPHQKMSAPERCFPYTSQSTGINFSVCINHFAVLFCLNRNTFTLSFTTYKSLWRTWPRRNPDQTILKLNMKGALVRGLFTQKYMHTTVSTNNL